MRFSVIIPTYNRAHLIMKTLESVISQEFKDFEIIVVDDGSTDDTGKLVTQIEDGRLHYFKKENAERGAARNFGIKKAKGTYITFLDSDDLLYPDYFSLANESLVKFSEPAFFHQGYEFVDEQGMRTGLPAWPFQSDLKNLAHGNPLSCMGVFMHREKTMKFRFVEDRALAASEDWELWVRLIANFGLNRDSRVAAGLVQHGSRSVMNADESALRLRKELAIAHAFEDVKVQEKFTSLKKVIDAYWDTYISLHLVLAGKRKEAAGLLWNAIKNYPAILFAKRSLVIMARLIW